MNAYRAHCSLYGVTYGGSPNTTFNLPNLTDRTPAGASATHPIGRAFGAASTTLTQTPALAIAWCVAVDGSYPPQPD